ncbi:MAG: aminoacyl-tRNA hydrolase [Rubrivivax sp.]|nr:aminoacyl-tRNA hydrolase [Rubrivivax sp.]
MLKNTIFIGITGSAGKTTTKDLLVGVLSHKWHGIGCLGSLNELAELATTILRVRPRHRFCVAEMSEDHPGVLREPLALVRPSIGIVTVVGNDHWSRYKSRDAIADEMSRLIEFLPATGTAVINADDPLLIPMAGNCKAHVITYGTSPGAELRGEDISAAWPGRLQMTVVRGEERIKVLTQLCGLHWTPSVLAAIGGGLAMGMTLEECAAAIASVAPYDGRMQPVTIPEGVTFIRDDFKAPLWTMDACLEFLKMARARRKIIVIGTLSDCGPRAAQKYTNVAKRAQDIADITIFVGAWASHVLKARKPGRQDALRVFASVRDAAQYIKVISLEGDLVLLKGTNTQDHLIRILMASTGGIDCWRDDCKLHVFCNLCPARNKPSGLPILPDDMSFSRTRPQIVPDQSIAIEPDEQVIIGLGNPEPRYAGTPHNIGYEVLDELAVSLTLPWHATPEAWIARGSWHGQNVCLIKMRASMNQSGAALKNLSVSMAFGPEQCILVHDDLDMPLGAVRTRMRGGAGGHRGVASILEAFQTDAFRRIKVGTGMTGIKLNRIEYVLKAFDAACRATVNQAIEVAAARARELLVSRAEHVNKKEAHLL